MRAVLELIKEGASLNCSNVKGQTPLHLAVKHGQIQAIHDLIHKKAKLNQADHEGNTALHLAAKRGEFIQQLVMGGANVNYANQQKFRELQTSRRCKVCTMFSNRQALKYLLWVQINFYT